MATPTNNPQPYTVQCVDCGKEWRQAQPPKGNYWCAFCWTKREEERANRLRYGSARHPGGG